MRSLIFFQFTKSLQPHYGSGFTELLTNGYQKFFLGGKSRPARKADNLTSVSRLSRRCGVLYVSQSYGPSRPVTGISELYF
jgi:hypothetical protein